MYASIVVQVLRMSTQNVNMIKTRRNSIARELVVKKVEPAIEDTVAESGHTDEYNENDADNNFYYYYLLIDFLYIQYIPIYRYR